VSEDAGGENPAFARGRYGAPVLTRTRLRPDHAAFACRGALRHGADVARPQCATSIRRKLIAIGTTGVHDQVSTLECEPICARLLIRSIADIGGAHEEIVRNRRVWPLRRLIGVR
jgi:hypothetical protein